MRIPSITVKLNDAGKIQSQSPVSIKTVVSTEKRLDGLTDVLEQNPQNGYTLVYDLTTDKYIVKKLSLNDIDDGTLDGGTF